LHGFSFSRKVFEFTSMEVFDGRRLWRFQFLYSVVVPFSSSYFPTLNVAGPIARGIFRIVMRHMSATVA